MFPRAKEGRSNQVRGWSNTTQRVVVVGDAKNTLLVEQVHRYVDTEVP